MEDDNENEEREKRRKQTNNSAKGRQESDERNREGMKKHSKEKDKRFKCVISRLSICGIGDKCSVHNGRDEALVSSR
jgi:hypothetical protein